MSKLICVHFETRSVDVVDKDSPLLKDMEMDRFDVVLEADFETTFGQEGVKVALKKERVEGTAMFSQVPVKTMLFCNISQEQNEKIKDMAFKSDRSVASIVRDALGDYIDNADWHQG